MSQAEFPISFLPKALVKLADNEKVSIWEPKPFRGRRATLAIEEKGISLDGYWRLSLIGNLLGGRLMLEWLLKPLFLTKRAQRVPVDAIRGLIVHSKKGRRTYHLFQQRNNNLVEVHVFTQAPQKTPSVAVPSLDDALKAFVPPRLWREESAG
ncbi:MAG: hypothetical protein ACLQGV_11905 [Bryobacteraceae bacterium]